MFVCYGDKSEQIRHVLKDWGWVQNWPTNSDDRLVFDFMWGGALRVDWMFGYGARDSMVKLIV